MSDTHDQLRRKLPILMSVVISLVLGVKLANPTSMTTIVAVGSVLMVLALPIFLRWHFPLLVLSLAMALQVFFLPGKPPVWMLMTAVSLSITAATLLVRPEYRIRIEPSLAWTLVVLAIVVLVTAYFRGGIGLRSLGGSVYGGKKYVYLLGAILCFFALACWRIPRGHVKRYALLYTLGSLSLILPNLAYLLGPSFYWMYSFVPVEYALEQAGAEFSESGMVRYSGVGFAMIGVFYLMTVKWGIEGILDWRRPWRFGVLMLVIGISMLGGFRSIIALYLLMFAILFLLERMWRPFQMAYLGTIAVVFAIVVVVFIDRMPMSVQRSLSFLPLDISPSVVANAEHSTQWRFDMWGLVWQEVPDYLWLGKGYAISPMDLFLSQESVRRGFMKTYEVSLVAGDYHSGPLSVLVIFGIPGCVALVAFWIAGMRVLNRNRRYSPPDMQLFNNLLFAMFLARIVFFIVVFGDFAADLIIFTGILGVSVALNGGMRRGPESEPVPVREAEFDPEPEALPQPA